MDKDAFERPLFTLQLYGVGPLHRTQNQTLVLTQQSCTLASLPLQAPTALLHQTPAAPGFLMGSYCLREHHSGTKSEGGPDVVTQRQCIPA